MPCQRWGFRCAVVLHVYHTCTANAHISKQPKPEPPFLGPGSPLPEVPWSWRAIMKGHLWCFVRSRATVQHKHMLAALQASTIIHKTMRCCVTNRVSGNHGRVLQPCESCLVVLHCCLVTPPSISSTAQPTRAKDKQGNHSSGICCAGKSSAKRLCHLFMLLCTGDHTG
jgi:hypothetical protein